jgi:hypothetical protein
LWKNLKWEKIATQKFMKVILYARLVGCQSVVVRVEMVEAASIGMEEWCYEHHKGVRTQLDGALERQHELLEDEEKDVQIIATTILSLAPVVDATFIQGSLKPNTTCAFESHECHHELDIGNVVVDENKEVENLLSNNLVKDVGRNVDVPFNEVVTTMAALKVKRGRKKAFQNSTTRSLSNTNKDGI